MTGTNISAAVCQSVTTGQPPTFTLADIQAANTTPNSHALVTLDVSSLKSVGFQQVAGLFAGQSLLDLVPPELTNLVDVLTAALTLDTVSYELLPDNSLATVAVSLGLVTPPTFNLFGDSSLPVSVASIDLTLANPGSSPTLSMVLNGTLALGAKAGAPALNVSLFVPALNLVAAMPSTFAPLPTSDFLTPLGISTTLFDSMAVEIFNFELDVLSKGLMLEVGLVDPPSPAANADGFTIQSVTFALEIGSGQLSLAVASTILVEVAASQKSLAFDADLSVVATRTPGSPLTPTWTITGALDVPATLAAQKLTGTTLTLTQLLAILGLSPPASTLLDTDAVTLGTLTLDCRYTPGTAPLFGLSGSVGVAWAGLGGVQLDAAFTFSHQSGATPATQGSVTVDATIDGFAVTLEYQFGGAQGSTLNASAFGGKLTGTYTAGTETLTLAYTAGQASPITLAQVIGDFIAMFTGEQGTALPDPWGGFFGDVTIPLESVSLAIDFKTSSAQITLTLDNASLLGVSVTGITLSYQSGKGFALTVQGNFSDLLGTASPSWDPTQPGAAPALPGTGSGNLQVNLLAIGQHMALSTAPATVSDAVTALSALLQQTGSGTLPGFTAGAGWTMALDLLLRGQLDIQLVFLDGTPTGLYGAQVTVASTPAKGGGGSGYLSQLAGLQAEIQYSTISGTLGEYQGILVPPTALQHLQVGMCALQLPSISARFYTDGEFYVDLGFPTGGDFSQSFGITAPPYQGYGGLYFGRLSPSQAGNLPSVTGGSFSTETEFGIGLKLGLYEGWSKGPLTASLSATLSGIFQGVFAEYTAQGGGGGSQEYWCIEASVGVEGEVTGSVDFTVIAASLDVAVSVTAEVLATAGYAFPVSIDATLAVSLSVTINLGIVHISHSFAFSTTLAETVTVGSNQQPVPPWTAASSISAAAASTTASTTAASGTAVGTASGGASAPVFTPFAGFKLPIALCVTPVLSQALNAQQAAEWVYVAETTLPASPNQGSSTNAATFDDFAQLVVAWFAQAVLGGSVPAAADPRTAVALTLAQIQQLEAALQGMRKTPAVPAAADVQAFFAGNLALGLQSVFDAAPQGNTTQPVPTVPFPLPPTCSVVVSQISTGATSLLQGQPQAVPAAAAPDGPGPAVLRDYLILVALSSLGSLQTVATAQAQTVSALFAALGDAADNIAGMVSRFMLHGQQLGGGPLYNATGQISPPFTPNAQETLTVSITSSAPSSYGLIFPNSKADGTGQIVLASSDPQPVVYSGQTISGWSGLAPTEGSALAAGLMPETATVQRRYRLGTGTQVVAQAGGSSVAVLRPLPTALRQALSAAGGLSAVSLTDPSTASVVAASTYAWAVQVEFSIRTLPAAGRAGAPVYAVHTVSASGLQRLQALYADLGAASPPVSLTALMLAVPVKGAASSTSTVAVRQVDVGSGDAILYQSQQAVPGTPDAAAFIATLLAAGLEQERGFILYVPDQNGTAVIPQSLFDGHGVAHLTLVASLSHATAADGTETLRPYVTAMVASPQAPAHPLSIAAAALTETVRRVPLGSVRMWQTNSTTPSNPAIAYQPTIDNLFGLVAFYPTVMDGQTTIYSGTTPVIVSQSNSGASNGTCRHTATFSILQHVEATAAQAQPSILSPDLPQLLSLAADPYQFVGNVFTARTKWVDLFGNMLPVRSAAGQIAGQVLQWTDPLLGLQGWPGLSFSYSFATAAGGDRLLSLALNWSQPTSLSSERMGELIATLVRAYHQLAHVNVTLSTSLVPTPLDALLEFTTPPAPTPGPYPVPPQTVAGALQSRLIGILQALAAGTGTAPALAPLQFVLPADTAFNTAPLYRLSATLDFALSLPLSLSGNQSFTARTVLPPLQSGNGSGSGTTIATARAFATAIETVLASQSPILLLGAGGGRIPDFWVLRWGAGGIDLTVSGTSWQGYAPAPLSPQLFSGSVPLGNLPASVNQFLQSYAGGDTLPATGAVAGLDCDAEMKRVLANLDRFLAPGVAVPALATAATAPAVAAMTALKTTLASSLSTGAVSLTDGSKAPAPVAAALQEAMRTKAEAFYDIDAVATLAVTTAALAGLDGLVLSGHLLPDGNQPAGLKLGMVSGSIAGGGTGGTGTLAVTLSGGRRLALDSATLPGSLRIDAIQVNVTDLAVDTTGALPPGPTALTCRQGEWLRVVNPPGPTLPVPASIIGLPRRTHPTAPVLRSQTATPNAGSGDALQTAKGWALSAEYHHRPVAQDTVLARIAVNGATETVTSGNVAGSLPTALGLHALVYPLLQSHGLAALQPYGFTLSAEEEGAIQSFAALCGTMATTLASTQDTVTAGQDTLSAPLVYSFEINEGPQSAGSGDLQSPWLVEVRQAGTAGSAADLAVGIPGYKPAAVSATADLAVYSYSSVADGTPLTAASGMLPGRRTLSMTGLLDVVGAQSAQLFLSVERNRYLWSQTASPTFPAAFLLTSGSVSFPNPARPFFTCTTPIAMTALSGMPASGGLVTYLSQFLPELVSSTMTGVTLPNQMIVQLVVSLETVLSPALPPVVTPIAMTLDIGLAPNISAAGAASWATQIADQVNGWVTGASAHGYAPGARPWSTASLLFQVTLIAPTQTPEQPVLVLRSVTLPLSSVTALQS
ncbi:hypothetical protein J2848_003358 [Azospirillum lipoferum]|uniref:Uncharacterized protein n=1 Tax=Azospirillum lipoferum TaxID=193 RepID=A0A5A9GM53_AZOLI|nr:MULTISPECIES: hypothetical protein [Azospirillum]KAA0595417.1 hypothetical protein FZ942_17515 [Azospirillum lipoferum]MCP1611680.1 hypothetical protein [Azospirillum lipoferum]MDW5533561.1 hypothetical protein [Azospirillum sp. NL1]